MIGAFGIGTPIAVPLLPSETDPTFSDEFFIFIIPSKLWNYDILKA
jgi:hypothetical protein